MEPGRFRQIEEVFQAAAEAPARERAGLLDRLCGQDAALRAEVESLLAASPGAPERIRGAIGGEAGRLMEVPRLLAGRFEIERPAGSGGMGAVYRARDRSTGAAVALKIMHPGGGGPNASERFAREARLLAEIEHPGIVSYVADGETPDGRRYLAMEWLDGEDLAARLGRGPLPLEASMKLVRRVAEALDVAHRRGVVHRDLKPGNVFLVGGDVARPKLLDFGIARRIVSSRAMTRAGALVGTPGYMAPEQVRGQGDITPSADVFSLGCVLYECLTGQAPFAAEHVAAVLTQILFEDPPPLDERGTGMPAPVSALVQRMLAKDPAQRLAGAGALLVELDALGALPEGSSAPTVTLPPRSSPVFAGREQGLFSLVVASPPLPVDPDATVSMEEEGADTQRRSDVRSALGAMGLSADFMADGSLVVKVTGAGSATDQAALAARAALVVKERWPAAEVALATGRGAVEGAFAVGEVADRAVRLLTAAETGSGVRVDALSARLLGPHFALTSSPEGAILIGEEREADVSRPLLGKPTPCVGREAELSSLEGLFTGCVEESEARAVLVTAPPGAGKSRLRHELLRRIERRGEPVTILAGRSDAMSAGAPYGVLAAAIRALAEVGSDAAPEVQRRLLRSRVGQHVAEADHERVVCFVGELCDVPFPDEGMPMLRAARHEPKIMGDCLRRAVLDFLAASLGAGPVLIVLDDLQWGDALTVSALDDALREQAGAPLLVLALARPEIHEAFPRLWTGHNVQEIALRGLSRKACERLIREVLGKDVPRAVVDRAIEQSAGNALFLEEMIRAIAEGRGEGQPETVVAMLQARMGRLAAGPRRVLQAASVFGQTFWSGGVAWVLAAAPADVTGWLSALIEAELVHPSPASRLHGEKEHAFRHALVRDAAYGLLTASDITTGHRVAGEFLEAAGELDAALVAEHFERGGEAAQAAGWYRRAAEQALEANDLTAVIAHARRAADLGAEGEVLGATLVCRGEAHVWRGDLAEAMACLEEALRVVPGGSPLYFRTVMALGWAASDTGDLQRLLALAADLRGALEGSPIVPALVAAARITSWFWNYDLVREVASFMALLTPRLADPGCDPVVAAYVGQLAAWQAFRDGDPAMACRPLELCAERFEGIGDAREAARARLNFGTYANILGQIDLAEAALRSSVAFFERVGMHGVVAVARANLSQTLLYRGATDEYRGATDEARALGELAVAALASSGNVRGEEHARSRLAAVLIRTGDLLAAESEASRAVQLSETVPTWRCLALATLAQVLLARARPVEALRVAREAVEYLDRLGAPDQGEVLARLTFAEALRASGDPDGARAAIASARAHLLAWAAKIGDPAWRESFLANIPENARTLALAAEWGAG